MNNPFQINEEDDENYLGEEDDDSEDYEEEPDSDESEISGLRASTPKTPRPVARAAPVRRLRVRPMTKRMESKHPNIVSLLMTRDDGRQLMFVRK